MRIVQFQIPDAGRRLGVVEGAEILDITAEEPSLQTTWSAFNVARSAAVSLEELLGKIVQRSTLQRIAYPPILNARNPANETVLLPPLDHVDHHHTAITGTGLTHLGSMESRDQMHTIDSSQEAEAKKSDSRKMFEMGLRNGKPKGDERGVAPEWFYKGNGFNLRAHGQALDIPPYAIDGGEEPELVGCYVIDDDGHPHRLGFALGNEWSDHATENINYLYLAPSKLRTCAVGPELVTDFDFKHVDLECSIERNGESLYQSGPLLSGEDNMSHSLANCEHHHFKYAQHRVPGDVHLHYFGTSKLSHSSRNWKFADGDQIEVSAPEFGSSLVNTVRRSSDEDVTWEVR